MPVPPETPQRPSLDHPRPGGEMRSAASDAPTRSQLLPFGSEWVELTSKPYFMPGVIGAVALALLFMLVTTRQTLWINVKLYDAIPVDIPVYTVVVAALLTLGGAYAVYRMVGKPKSWWLMPAVGLFTAFTAESGLMSALQSFYKMGNSDVVRDDSVPMAFIKMFFLAGLPEETLKSIPVFAGLLVGIYFIKRLTVTNPARQLAVLEPLDGILIGAASGFGFAFSETLLQYVPSVIVESRATVNALLGIFQQAGVRISIPEGTPTLVAIALLFNKLVQAVGFERANFELQQFLHNRESLGLELMIPRLLANIFGHSAYAGVFGYFIGLSAIRPAGRIKTILIGLATAACLHALWNSAAKSLFMYFLVSLLAFVTLAACIIKGRRLSPDRSQLITSQLIDRFAGSGAAGRPSAVAPGAAAFAAPSAAFRAMPTATGAAPMGAAVPAAQSQQPMHAAPAPGGAVTAREVPRSVTWDEDPALRLLEIGSARIPAVAGTRLRESQFSGIASGRGDGIVAEVSVHPADPGVFGLKNLSDRTWTFISPGRGERELAPGRSIKLEAGLQVRIGQVTVHVR